MYNDILKILYHLLRARSKIYIMRNKVLIFLFLLGLSIRLILLPWFGHSDLLSMNYRAYLMQEHGLWGLDISQLPAHFVYALNQILLIEGVLDIDLNGFFPAEFGTRPSSTTASTSNWLEMSFNSHINILLIAFKMPHLVFDMLALVIGYKLFKNREIAWLTAWWLNPIHLYVFYIFGRHDVLSILLLLVFLSFLSRKQYLSSVWSILLAVATRIYPLLLFPSFLVQLVRSTKFKSLLKISLGGLFATAVWILVVQVLPFNASTFFDVKQSSYVETISVTQSLVSLPLNLVQKSIAYSNLIVIGLAVFLTAVCTKPKQEDNILDLSSWYLLPVLILFTFSTVSPQYLVWLSPFLVVVLTYRPKVWRTFLVMIFGWFFSNWLNPSVHGVSHWLLLPISSQFFTVPLAPQILETTLGNQFLYLAQTISVILFKLSFLLLLWEVRSSIAVNRKQLLTILKNVSSKVASFFVVAGTFFVLSVSPTAAITEYPRFSPTKNSMITIEEQESFLVDSTALRTGIFWIVFNNHRVYSDMPIVFNFKSGSEVLQSVTVNRNNIYSDWWFPIGFNPQLFSEQNQITLQIVSKSEPSIQVATIGDELLLFAGTDLSFNQVLTRLQSDLEFKFSTQPQLIWYHFLTGLIIITWVISGIIVVYSKLQPLQLEAS